MRRASTVDSVFEGGEMPSIDPTVPAHSRCSPPPHRNTTRGDAHDAAFALRPGFELRMPEQTASVLGNLKRPNIEVDQAHAVVAKSFVEEVEVSAYERRVPQGAQQGNDLVVFHSLTTDIAANLAELNTPPAQFCVLAREDVLVQNQHAQTDLSRYSSACWTMARPAKRIASAIACREMLP